MRPCPPRCIVTFAEDYVDLNNVSCIYTFPLKNFGVARGSIAARDARKNGADFYHTHERRDTA